MELHMEFYIDWECLSILVTGLVVVFLALCVRKK